MHQLIHTLQHKNMHMYSQFFFGEYDDYEHRPYSLSNATYVMHLQKMWPTLEVVVTKVEHHLDASYEYTYKCTS